ncbi:MAG: tyrosine-type recombinase/integrase [Acidobacteriota bacterium]
MKHYKPGTLRRRPDGRYWFDVRINGKRYIRLLGIDKTVAQRVLDKLRHEKGEEAVAEKNGVFLPASPDPASFNAVADEFFAKCCVGAVSERSYATSLAHLRAHLGKIVFAELKPSDIMDYKQRRQAETYEKDSKELEIEGPRGYALSSINRELACLKKLFTWREESDLPIPFLNKKIKMFPRKKAEQRRYRILSPAEEQRLVAVTPAHLLDIIQCALWSGMRLGEILNLRRAAFDLRAKRPEIVLRGDETKSGEARRIPIVPSLAEVLKRQPEINQYVFNNPETGEPWASIKRSWATAKRKAKIRDLHFHDLRHTFATRFLGKPVFGDLVTLKHILGHSDINITALYVTPYPLDIQARMAGLVLGTRTKLERKASPQKTAVPVSSSNPALYA